MKKTLLLGLILIVVASAFALTYDEATKKIDWSSIDDGTIVLVTTHSDFGFMGDSGQNKGYNIFVPSYAELLKFLQFYNFEFETLEKNGKTVYVIKETGKKDERDAKKIDCLPSEVKNAAENNLPKKHPKMNSVGGGKIQSCDGCGDDCCYEGESCCNDELCCDDSESCCMNYCGDGGPYSVCCPSGWACGECGCYNPEIS